MRSSRLKLMSMTRVVAYPGTFNPITNGHTDLIDRALTIFDKVVLAIGTSSSKHPATELAGRISLCQQVLEDYGDRVAVEGFNTLLVDYLAKRGIPFVLRGIRDLQDFEYEFQMCEMNKALAPAIEYVFLPTSKDVSFISSTLVREIASLGGDIRQFVHPAVAQALMAAAMR